MDFRKGTVLWNESTYSAYEDSYAGVTAMILSQKITNLCEHGVIVRGRAQFLTYLNPTTEKIGILNIYGHSYTGPRANLWQKIANYPLPDSGFLTPCSHKFLPEVLIIHLTRTTITRGYGWDLANPQLNIRPLSHIYKNQTKRSHTATNSGDPSGRTTPPE